jgi:hypothetical protein
MRSLAPRGAFELPQVNASDLGGNEGLSGAGSDQRAFRCDQSGKQVEKEWINVSLELRH